MAACAVGGAAGVLLDWQMALTRECGLPLRMRDRIAAMDGSESVIVSGPQGRQLRLFWRPGMSAKDEIERVAAELTESSGTEVRPDDLAGSNCEPIVGSGS